MPFCMFPETLQELRRRVLRGLRGPRAAVAVLHLARGGVRRLLRALTSAIRFHVAGVNHKTPALACYDWNCNVHFFFSFISSSWTAPAKPRDIFQSRHKPSNNRCVATNGAATHLNRQKQIRIYFNAVLLVECQHCL